MSNMDNNPKALTFGGENFEAPLADISQLSEREKENLSRKARLAFGTYSYDVFKSDEEFELSLACEMQFSYENEEMTKDEIMGSAALYRGFYYHKKKFKVWKKDVLDPKVKEMADYALNSPQYEAIFLLELERRKMECMDLYFSHSVTADSDGNYPGCRWLRICIKILGFLTDKYNIPEKNIAGLNLRNVSYPVRKKDIERFEAESDTDLKIVIGRDIYWHKAHRLYCHIREHALHTWWD